MIITMYIGLFLRTYFMESKSCRTEKPT